MDADSILAFLREKAKRPLKPKEIARALKVPTNQYRQLKDALRELERSGRIYKARRGRYATLDKMNLVVGRLQVTRGGHGFVVPDVTRDDEGKRDIFIRASKLGNAFAGDRVVARIDHPRREPNPEGSIVRVLERARSQVVGVYRRSGRYGWVVPEDPLIHRDVFVAPNGADVPEGHMVVVEIVDWGSGKHGPAGEVVEVLGPLDKPGVDILSIVHGHELPTSFPDAVVREAEKAARGLSIEAELERRVDYREVLTFTIDPEDAKDHDDALSIEPLGDGLWKVGVHIADVSHFVKPDSTLDREARERGTSVYLVDRVIPMLPEVISGDVCSLRPDEDRLALTVSMEMDAKASLKSARAEETIIRSRHRLSYEQAQEIIDGGRSAPDEVRDALVKVRDLSLQLRSRRQQRGGLDFDLPEARVVLNSAGEPTHIEELMRLDSHRLIEEFMILANETVAGWAAKREWPFIYRVHEPPDPVRLEHLNEFLSRIGLTMGKGADRTPRVLQKVLKHVDGRPEETLVSTLVLRSMKQARYAVENKGHFGLGSEAYTHFTSPIRRYPDLAVHRVIREVLIRKSRVSGSLAEQLPEIANHSSLRERQAMEAERDTVELKKLEYMERHVGDEFAGTIAGVTAYGMFVLVDEVLVEGLLHVSNLEDDYYQFEEDEYALVGRSSQRRFRLGDRLDVRILAVDRSARELDLALA